MPSATAPPMTLLISSLGSGGTSPLCFTKKTQGYCGSTIVVRRLGVTLRCRALMLVKMLCNHISQIGGPVRGTVPMSHRALGRLPHQPSRRHAATQHDSTAATSTCISNELAKPVLRPTLLFLGGVRVATLTADTPPLPADTDAETRAGVGNCDTG